MKKGLILLLTVGLFIFMGFSFQDTSKKKLTKIESLGKKLFFDETLSNPEGMSCATCHDKKGGWAGPDSEINKKTGVYPGALETRAGNRKPPTASYSGFAPKLHRDEKEGNFIGGLFFDGRATGWEIGDPLAEQAMGPFLNPVEQNLADKKALVKKVIKASYAPLFREVFGKDSLSIEKTEKAFEQVAIALAAFQRSYQLNPFNSRFDEFWQNSNKKGLKVEKISEKNYQTYSGLGLSDQEVEGLMLFNTKGLCADCHVLTSENGIPPLFTDFTYDNLGVPRNPNNPFYKQDKKTNPLGEKWVDEGLGAFLKTTEKYKKYADENIGKYKVPTLRNIDMRESDKFVKSFMHNGFFTNLRDVVDFYNTRDLPEKKWAEPEIKQNVNKDELGNLKLTDREVDLIVLFMKTLSDRD